MRARQGPKDARACGKALLAVVEPRFSRLASQGRGRPPPGWHLTLGQEQVGHGLLPLHALFWHEPLQVPSTFASPRDVTAGVSILCGGSMHMTKEGWRRFAVPEGMQPAMRQGLGGELLGEDAWITAPAGSVPSMQAGPQDAPTMIPQMDASLLEVRAWPRHDTGSMPPAAPGKVACPCTVYAVSCPGRGQAQHELQGHT